MKKISPYDLQFNPFEAIDRQWAMVTTCADGKTNTMTASWGGVGILWGKPVAYVLLRPQRFTRELMDKSETFSLCFLPEQYREQLLYCGSHSGRDIDKLAECGFSAAELDGAPVLEQAQTVLTCRKLFRQQFTPDSFLDASIAAENYPDSDYHYIYIAEILGAYQTEI